ncbi:hypothetical protein MBM_01769 [Drepanopeziza brunnea f. sp. 'multigermtubi' MB_m1]|uniref:Uncharacterized protein n=1 Tax=Marssonina brunnea f. sp. multigermtubi (strain MB_m1) TaxID=1072389 RepID=K1X456_MARBU|nr:uncharacterized protein MBM_01769 [Drepanopeziza brunnea f. sp. 'multigermtubi' MB_m1]EKD19817.1 hypothetical protein MBM_01769 [Drepanopeziza brunnea f. sp. 'multigermtubi' MB_m1]
MSVLKIFFLLAFLLSYATIIGGSSIGALTPPVTSTSSDTLAPSFWYSTMIVNHAPPFLVTFTSTLPASPTISSTSALPTTTVVVTVTGLPRTSTVYVSDSASYSTITGLCYLGSNDAVEVPCTYTSGLTSTANSQGTTTVSTSAAFTINTQAPVVSSLAIPAHSNWAKYLSEHAKKGAKVIKVDTVTTFIVENGKKVLGIRGLSPVGNFLSARSSVKETPNGPVRWEPLSHQFIPIGGGPVWESCDHIPIILMPFLMPIFTLMTGAYILVDWSNSRYNFWKVLIYILFWSFSLPVFVYLEVNKGQVKTGWDACADKSREYMIQPGYTQAPSA